MAFISERTAHMVGRDHVSKGKAKGYHIRLVRTRNADRSVDLSYQVILAR